jgi:tripartite-type tricarboxylate transporter receptor subunit TctC
MEDNMARSNNRRTFLKGIGVAGIGSLAGCAAITGGGGGGEYPSEDITYQVPYGEGSGFDTYARGLAPIWEEQFDSDVNVVVENVTGGGGRRSTEQLYNADPDGYTVGFLNIPGFAISQAIQDPDYNLREMTHLGRVVRATYILQTNPNNDVNSWEDLASLDQVDWGVTGVGSSASFAAALTANAADINLNFVAGYDGGTDVMRALQQGELDAALYTGSTSRPFIEDGRTQPLLQYTDTALSWLGDDVPLTEETDTFQGYQNLNLSRIISAPPDVEDDVAETLRTTLWSALQSDEFAEWAEGAERSLANRAQGDTAAEVVDSAFEIANENRETLEQYVDQ